MHLNLTEGFNSHVSGSSDSVLKKKKKIAVYKHDKCFM